jgi:hypothetical protein
VEERLISQVTRVLKVQVQMQMQRFVRLLVFEAL